MKIITMLDKHNSILICLALLICYTSCTQKMVDTSNVHNENIEPILSHGPKVITRNIIQDKKGNLWIAAFDGLFRYDGKTCVNMILPINTARFFSVLEDKQGNIWAGSIGSGIYRYDGKSFQYFTTKEGLISNEITTIYEDKNGDIWFGGSGGASRYDGKAFQNYVINGEVMYQDHTTTFDTRQPYEVNAMVVDNSDKMWFASRGNTFIYDGKTFVPFTHDGIPFKNVRHLMKDKQGNIWLAGQDGLWLYKDKQLTMITERFVGYIIQDKKGNIWASSEKDKSYGKWTLSKYEATGLFDPHPKEIIIVEKSMIFGILEDAKGYIWYGDGAGVHRLVVDK